MKRLSLTIVLLLLVSCGNNVEKFNMEVCNGIALDITSHINGWNLDLMRSEKTAYEMVNNEREYFNDKTEEINKCLRDIAMSNDDVNNELKISNINDIRLQVSSLSIFFDDMLIDGNYFDANCEKCGYIELKYFKDKWLDFVD